MMKSSKKGLKSKLDHTSNSNLDTVSESKMELDSSNSAGNVVGSSSRSDTNENTNTEAKAKTFFCNFCKRKFSSAQALGGHQNAHKQERALKKFRQGLDAGVLGSPYFPCYPFPTLSTHSLYGRSFSGALDSTICKPELWSNGFRYSHSWSRQGHGMQNSSPFDAFGIMRSDPTPSSGQENGTNASAETLSLFPNAATNSSSQVINKLTPTKTSDHLSIPEEIFKVESSNIDLSLKL